MILETQVLDLLGPALILKIREGGTYTVVVPAFLTLMHLAKVGCQPVVALGDKMKMFRDWVTQFRIFNDVTQVCQFLTLGGDNNETLLQSISDCYHYGNVMQNKHKFQ